MSGMPVDGQIIGGGTIMNGTVMNGTVMGGMGYNDSSWVPRPGSDGYSSNKFDADGHRIISEDPLPPGAVPAN